MACSCGTDVLGSYGLCTKVDDFIEDKAMWIAELNDGTKIFSDDDRRGVSIPSAWMRLGAFLSDNEHLHIQRIYLRFGTHRYMLAENKPYWFFSNGILQAATQTHGLHFFIFGWPDEGHELLLRWIKLPELIELEQRPRLLKNCQPKQIIGLTQPLASV